MARWTDLAPWRGPTRNEGDGDGTPLEPEDHVTEVRGLILHIAAGWYQGTIDWQRNPTAQVSSHFIGGRAAGQRAQLVDTSDRAWTQRDGNSRWLSVEMEGFLPSHSLYKPGWDSLTEHQIEFAAQLLARAHRDYDVPLRIAKSPGEWGLGHHSMGAENGVNWGHPDCPGPAIIAQKPLILARANAIVNGAPDVQLTDKLTPWGLDSTFAGAVVDMHRRLDLLANQLGLAGRLDELRTLVKQAIAEAADDPELPQVPPMGDEQVQALADRVAAALPTVESIADAVVDKEAARLQA